MTVPIARRKFVVALGGAALWPLAARAQQGERMRRIGVLMPGDENDPLAKTFVSAFIQALAGLGWTDGRNVRMDLRWAGADINRMLAQVRASGIRIFEGADQRVPLARELVSLQPEIILTSGTP